MGQQKAAARTRAARDVADAKGASKTQIVTAILSVLGGGIRYVLLDELAIACHRLVPQAFAWPEYGWLPNVDLVRVTLVDVKRCGLVEEEKESRGKSLGGYRLTQAGQEWVKRNKTFLEHLQGRLPDAGTYSHLDRSALVAIAVLSAVRADGMKDVSRERVVAEAYRMFPEAFAMKAYRGWPDASVVDQALRTCSSLTGTPAGFSLVAAEREKVEALSSQIHVVAASGFGATERRGTKGVALKMAERVARTRLFRSWREASDVSEIRAEEVPEHVETGRGS
jgi:DNA-binding PadR family transcriptional regulator